MPTGRSPRAALALGLALLAGAAPIALAQPEADPAAIVAAADRIRFPQEGFQVDVTITSSSPDREADVREYRILSKGNDNTIVLTVSPASERGQMMLMKARDLWVFLPRVSQPVRLPLSQRLTGQVANGDLARANFSGDYTATLLRTETLEGKALYVLELKAAERGVTYPRVLYWVEQATSRPFKAEFYTLSGRLLKTCRYEEFRTMEGAIRPTRLVMADALKKGDRSVMDYRDMTLRALEDKVFTKDYLKKLQ
jgi:hypothetical protein